MAADSDREREDYRPVPAEDSPTDGNERGGEDDHRDGNDEADDEREPEPTKDLGDLEPEVGALDLFLRRTPGDVVRDEVGNQRLGEMDTEAAEEEEAVEAMCQTRRRRG